MAGRMSRSSSPSVSAMSVAPGSGASRSPETTRFMRAEPSGPDVRKDRATKPVNPGGPSSALSGSADRAYREECQERCRSSPLGFQWEDTAAPHRNARGANVSKIAMALLGAAEDVAAEARH